MNRSSMGIICCECGEPIPGMGTKWKKGAPVCLSCLFGVSALRTKRAKRIRIRTGENSLKAGWVLGLMLAVAAGVYLLM